MTTAPKLIREQLLALEYSFLRRAMPPQHGRWTEYEKGRASAFEAARDELMELRSSLAAEPVGGESYVTFNSSGIHVDLNRFLSTDVGKALIKPAAKVTHSADGQSQLELTADGLVLGIGEHDLYAKQPDSAEGDSYERRIIAPLDKELSANLRATDEWKGEQAGQPDITLLSIARFLAELLDDAVGSQRLKDCAAAFLGAHGTLVLECLLASSQPSTESSEYVGVTAKIRDCTCQKYEGRDCRRCFEPPYPNQLSAAPQPEQPARDGDSEWAKIRKQYVSLMAKIDGRFRPDYMGPVERAHITSDEWDLISRYEDAAEHLSNEQARIIASLTQPPQQADGGAINPIRFGQHISDLTVAAAAGDPLAERSLTFMRHLIAHPPKLPGVGDDVKLLDALASEYWKLEPFDMPTGAGDADVGWRVIQFHGSEPRERVVATVYKDDPRAALRTAVAGGGEHE